MYIGILTVLPVTVAVGLKTGAAATDVDVFIGTQK
jgi:hypothetical protein